MKSRVKWFVCKNCPNTKKRRKVGGDEQNCYWNGRAVCPACNGLTVNEIPPHDTRRR